MLRKFFKFFLLLFQIIFASLLIIISAFFWHLHREPINIDPYIPYLVQTAKSSDLVSDISIQSAQIRWGSIRHPIDFFVENFKVFDDKKRLLLEVPQISFSFSFQALFRGIIAPRTIALYKPYLHLQIDKTGNIKDAKEEKSAFSFDSLLRILKSEQHLIEFSLIDAEIKITDSFHNAVWHLPKSNLTYARRFKKRQLKGAVGLQMKNNRLLTVYLNGSWREKGKKVRLSINVDDLDLTNSQTAQKYPYLKNFTTPVSLNINMRLDPAPLMAAKSLHVWRKAIEKIDFQVSGGEGIINLPDPVIARYNFSNFDFNGSWYAGANNFDISTFHLNLQNGGKAWGSFSVSGIDEALNEKTWGKIQAELNAQATGIPVNMLPDYWPASVGPDVHAWIKQNLKGGLITDGTFKLHFTGLTQENGIDADQVDGNLNIVDTQVRYIDEMPLVDNVDGNVRLTRDKITITVNRGNTESIQVVPGGTLIFYDLTKQKSFAALDFNLNGSVRDILNVLNSPLLELSKMTGIDANKTSGTAQGNLKLNFPIGDAFTNADQLDIKATASVNNADVDDIALGYGIQKADLQVDLDNKDLLIKGTGLFFGEKAQYSVSQSFDTTKKTASDITFNVNLTEQLRSALNTTLQNDFITSSAIQGVMPLNLHLTINNDGSEVLKLNTDLKKANINFPQISWIKPVNVNASAFLELKMKQWAPVSIPVIKISDANNTDIRGKIFFTNKSKISQIFVNSIKTKRTNAKLRVRFLPKQRVSIELNGSQWDLSDLLKQQNTTTSPSVQKNKTNEDNLNLNIQASIDKLWLNEKGFSENNAFSASYRSGWQKMEAIGYVGKQKVPLRFSLTPSKEKNKYNISLTSQDAGYTLKALDYISNVKGGNLFLQGIYTPETGTKGIMRMTDFYLEEQQTFTRLLMLTSLTGIIDILKGEGLFFDKAEIPYTLDSEALSVEDALISGASLGITLNGKYFRQTGYLNLYGSLIPFYTLNSFLGKIPLIGTLFSGEKGGGLIAPTYTIKGNLPSPDISVNAFSALAPGAIRSLFGQSSEDISDESQQEKTSNHSNKIHDKKVEFKPAKPSSETELTDSLQTEFKTSDPSLETEFTDFLHHEPLSY